MSPAPFPSSKSTLWGSDFVPAYFASDVHLRLDHPERGQRFARWVRSLEPGDSLTIVGDLCDFWMVSRQLKKAPTECAGLKALHNFRLRDGQLAILPGNHDHWLMQFYEETLGARAVDEPLKLEIEGLRLFVAHGHRYGGGGSRAWKAWMEGAAFLNAFRLCPAPMASALDNLLEGVNIRRRSQDNARQIAIYETFAATQADVDLVVFGHVHQIVDRPSTTPRLVVLGGWHTQGSYLKVDSAGANLIIIPDSAPIPC